MATTTKNLGIVTAYGYAVSAGYSGTEDEFAEMMLGSKNYYDLITEAYEDMSSSDNYLASRSYAVGDTETRDGEETDNSKYYAEQAAASESSAASALESITELVDGIDYSASTVTYDNTDSGLESTTVQAAIDEVASDLDSIELTAEAVSYDGSTSGLESTTVQAAIDEVASTASDSASDISDLQTAVATNTTNIATNTSDIDTLESTVAGLSGTSDTSTATVGSSVLPVYLYNGKLTAMAASPVLTAGNTYTMYDNLVVGVLMSSKSRITFLFYTPIITGISSISVSDFQLKAWVQGTQIVGSSSSFADVDGSSCSVTYSTMRIMLVVPVSACSNYDVDDVTTASSVVAQIYNGMTITLA